MKLKITFLLVSIFFCLTVTAQTKVGTVDSEYIITKMPQLLKVQERIKKYTAKLDSTFQLKVKVYDAKVKAYNDGAKTFSEADKQTKYTELGELDKDLKKYQQNGAKMIQLKRGEFMRPIYKKVGEVIQQVAKENSYTQILTSSGNEFAYIDEKFDITKIVMAKLGIKE